MSEQQPKKAKHVKRIINCDIPYGLTEPRPWYDKSARYYLEVTYIIDHGNLIQDVHKKYTEIICFKDFDAREQRVAKCQESKKRVQKMLETQIRSTGANQLNAELCARKLLQK